jgi:hypothetical protein
MANSILSLIFPLSGEGCPFSSGADKIPNVNLPLPTKKLFSKNRKHESKFGMIVTSGRTQEDIVFHQRRLLFQACVTKAAAGKKVVIVSIK